MQVLVNEAELTLLETCALRIAEEHPEDGEECWCNLTVGINEFGLHTGVCRILRKHFKIGEKK